jgi:hypothetical protein
VLGKWKNFYNGIFSDASGFSVFDSKWKFKTVIKVRKFEFKNSDH